MVERFKVWRLFLIHQGRPFFILPGVRQFAHGLEAGKLGSQEAGSDEAFEPSSIQAFQPSGYFTDT
jgi:hypothetical protein